LAAPAVLSEGILLNFVPGAVFAGADEQLQGD
jgi:hypothetical protein